MVNILLTGLLFGLLDSSAPVGPVPPQSVPLFYELAEEVSKERLESDVRTLVAFGTRHTLSQTASEERGIGAARRWIKDEFETISAACGGCLEVMAISEVIEGEETIPEPTEVVNIIAIQHGTIDPARMVLLSGDIDSRVTDIMDASSPSPGANDNATGVAATLEAARLLSQHEFAGSIVYAALSGEEQGLYGGKILARHAREQGWNLKAVVNNDMIGNIEGFDGVVDNHTARVFSEGPRHLETAEEAEARRRLGGEVDSPSRNLARYIAGLADTYIGNLDIMTVYRRERVNRSGHHLPFSEAGYPAVRLMEAHEHYYRQHQDVRSQDGRHYGDVIEGVDFDYMKKIVGLDVVTLASLASAPPFPSKVDIEGAVSHSTTLHWQRPPRRHRENLAGYKVYWRLTDAPRWTDARYVGDVDEVMLENIIIDNYFFGVASVAKNGAESPVVFPGPAGSFDPPS